MERRYFKFKRQYFEAAKDLDTVSRSVLYNAICEYGLNGEVSSIVGLSKSIFNLIKTDIDNEHQKLKQQKSYKSKLLTEIEPQEIENKEYLDITISFQQLFKNNLAELNISNTSVDKMTGKSIDDIRKLIELDKRTIEEIREVYVFLQHNEFWKRNILSTGKLRKQFEKLLIQSRSNGKNRESNKESWNELGNILEKHFGHLEN